MPHRPGARLGICRVQVRLGSHQGGLLDLDLNLIGGLVELDEEVPFFYAVVVVDKDADDLPGHPGSYERDVAVDVGIVRADGVEGGNDVGCEEVGREGQNHDEYGQKEPFSAGGLARTGGRLRGSFRFGRTADLSGSRRLIVAGRGFSALHVAESSRTFEKYGARS